ncbi:hypothetical protein NL676_020700 [Syzygium grande]|nr:hypothetical protein NL676_020700 [Syzygium grande]
MFYLAVRWYARNASVTSCPARVSSGTSPPGYYFTHSLTSYTFPWIEIHKSPRELCFQSSSDVMYFFLTSMAVGEKPPDPPTAVGRRWWI